MRNWILSLTVVAGLAQAATGQVDTEFVSENFMVAVVVQPKKLLATPGLKIPHLSDAVAGIKEARGIDLHHIEEVIYAGGPMIKPDSLEDANERTEMVLFRSDQPFEQDQLRKLYPNHQAEKLGSRDIYSGDDRTYSYCLVKPNVLMLAPKDTLSYLLQNTNLRDSGLIRRLKTLDPSQSISLIGEISSLRKLVAKMKSENPSEPVEGEIFIQKAEFLELHMHYATLATELKVLCTTAANANQVLEAWKEFLDSENESLELAPKLPPELEKQRPRRRLHDGLKKFEAAVEGTTITAQLDVSTTRDLLILATEGIAGRPGQRRLREQQKD